jgi:hypothetical protein
LAADGLILELPQIHALLLKPARGTFQRVEPFRMSLIITLSAT